MKHVVVDGSNIATEGREAPSLAQLDEAVQAFLEEYSPEVVTVVVDATFPNRIAVSERAAYEDAVAANELITPPAGAIGRGDGFVLQIARRANATILSNDSFQEFHGMYPWLFERGRLIGGKPVPHVGWVFMERAPVRGPTSRRAVSEARKEARSERVLASGAAAVTDEATAPVGSPAKRSVRGGRTRKSVAAAAASSAAPVSPNGSSEELASSPDDDPVAIPVVAATPGTEAPEDSTGARSGGRKARAAAVDKANGGIDPYNDPLPFIEFVGAHAVGSLVEATIERFSSHGAYAVVGDARGYIPLRYLGDPPPRSAKELLTLGEVRTLVVVAVDPPRRGIDLGLPEAVTVPSAAPIDDLDVEVLADTADVFHTYDVDDAVVAPEPAPAPAKRSRKRAAAAPAPDEGADAVAEAAPAKRSRRKAAAPAVEPAPAKRSRARGTDAAVEAPVEGAAPAVEPAPAKRSRRKAAATPAPVPADTTAAPVDEAPAAEATGPEATALEATTPAPAPAKRTRKRAAARSGPATEAAVDDTAAPEASSPAPSPAPAKRTRRRSPDASPDTAPDAPSTGPASPGVPEPAAEAEPAPAKRSRKRSAAAPTDATPDPAEAAEAAPARRSRRRAAAAPSSEAAPDATPAPAPTGESEEAAEAAPARRSRKRASTASSEPATRSRKRSAGTGGEARGEASEPAPAPAKRSRRRAAAASTDTTSGTTSDTGSEPADAQPAAPARKRTRRATASSTGSR